MCKSVVEEALKEGDAEYSVDADDSFSLHKTLSYWNDQLKHARDRVLEASPSSGVQLDLSQLQLGARDSSSEIVAALLLMDARERLPELQELRARLEARPSRLLPLVDVRFAQLKLDSAAHSAASLLSPLSRDGAAELAFALEASLSWRWMQGGEQHTLLAVEATFVQPLLRLDDLAPAASRLHLLTRRDAGDSTSGLTSSSSTGAPLRPDLQVLTSDGLRLLFKGEDKAASLPEAVSDLSSKMARVWSPLFYGNLDYLLCYAAAGGRFQLYAVVRSDNSTVPVSRVYDLTRPTERVLVFALAVQVHRLLQQVNAALPAHTLPMDSPQSREHCCANGPVCLRTLTFESATGCALKCITNWTAYAADVGTNLAACRRAYERTSGAPGVVQAVSPPACDSRGCYAIRTRPLGLRGSDAAPRCEQSLRCAVHGVLHGLAALHAAGVCHRDLRWENVACTPDRAYFLLDLEACALDGAPAAALLRCWDGHTLQPGPGPPGSAAVYTAAGDVRGVGLLMRECAERCDASPAARALMARLLAEAVEARPTAIQALDDPWLACTGRSCIAAGRWP